MVNMDEIPDEFICPIYKDVMAYPFTTVAGNSYEYEAIVEWLKKSNLDPLTGVKLNDTRVFPNNTLRSQIQAWLQENNKTLHPSVEKPPKEAYNLGQHFVPLPNQDQVIKYHTNTSLNEERKLKKTKVPESFTAFNHTYTFSSKENQQKRRVLLVQCDSGPFIEMPDKEMFVTAQGIVFYDSSDIRDTRVLPGTDFNEPCKYSVKCNKDSCKFAHPFVCPKGVNCNGCKFLHPDKSSIVSSGAECKYGTSCSNPQCKFAHPNGRLTVPRQKARVFITHSLTLQQLIEPIPLKLDVPDKATCFQFQGEFVFFFVPYIGTWAKEHYQQVMAYRFDATNSNSYKEVGTYSLDKHYCNSVVGSGRYMVISFWPYEEEAIRTVWEGIRISREMEKQMKKKDIQIKNLEGQLKLKDAEIAKYRAQAAFAKQQVFIARQEARMAREEARQARKEKMAWRKTRQDYERARLERLRMRDPIHIYALQENCSGFAKEDWKLVLDYHKGAHDLKLHKPNNAGVQHLEITEHDTVYHFDLVVPGNVSLLNNLPLVPGRLCEHF